ncbi:cupin domain-containing protein [Aureimonas sp. AU22]|uniref:(R)-mandelonitrile lyase n=1 Tax=Aureimonas sp. AU22 TaxID=1638162 RepID=UPI000780B923|nr:cupin domain-containing protein [Aureimonas sp. AU22]
MLLLATTIFAGAMLASAAPNPDVRITKAAANPPAPGPEAYFSGEVSVATRFQAEEPARVGGATVTFQPGARTAWHTHPLGQTLIVTDGSGLIQREGGPVEEIRPGDVVWIPPGVKHWHGAGPSAAMTHVAVAEAVDGSAVEWLEKVTDDQYAAR